MPLYFFDVDDGGSRMIDDTGTQLPGLKQAREEAMRLLPGVVGEQSPDGDRRTIVAKVRDGDGRTVFVATLSIVAEWTV